MNVSLLIDKNRQKADMETYDLQKILYLIHHLNPEAFLQLLMTSYLYP